MRAPQLPGYVVLNVTDACNLRCGMCYAWGDTGCFTTGDPPKKPEVLDFGVTKQLIGDLAKNKPVYSFFGGEPLMYPRLEELVVELKRAGSFVETPTNATLLPKYSPMLVETGFDLLRVSIDGPREVNDVQRGTNSFDRAMAGLEAVIVERERRGRKAPLTSIVYTVTPENHLDVERFFLGQLDMRLADGISINMQSFVTEGMGAAYADLIKEEYGISSECFWRGMLRPVSDFDHMDFAETARQIRKVVAHYAGAGKSVITLPRVITGANLSAYFGASWDELAHDYSGCPAPWTQIDVTAAGDVAPCHLYFDLTVGNLHEQSIREIWYGPKFAALRDRLSNKGLLPICHGCCILYFFGDAKRRVAAPTTAQAERAERLRGRLRVMQSG